MSVRNIRTEYPIARKNHFCQVSEDFLESFDSLMKKNLTSEECIAIAKYSVAGHRILKGQKYRCETNECDGDIYQWRANNEIYNILSMFNMLTDDY